MVQKSVVDDAADHLAPVPVFAMLALAIAFLAGLAPFIPFYEPFNAPAGGNYLFVDLGHQLNLGQSVLVRFMCYELRSAVPEENPKL